MQFSGFQFTGNLVVEGIKVPVAQPVQTGGSYDANNQGVLFSTPGTYTFEAPAGVTSVSAVCVGGGGGAQVSYGGAGSGGALGWKNNITVVPGQSYTVVVGAGGGNGQYGGDSYFVNTSTVFAGGGTYASYSGPTALASYNTYVGDGGGRGGRGCGYDPDNTGYRMFGGGGAGGYLGDGGDGGGGSNNMGNGTGGGYAGFLPVTGSGGGGGGGTHRSGGGVGVYGHGPDGTSPGRTYNYTYQVWNYYGGTAGSNGSGMIYGGGGSWYSLGGYPDQLISGSGGAVRILWGSGRAFPSTNVGGS